MRNIILNVLGTALLFGGLALGMERSEDNGQIKKIQTYQKFFEQIDNQNIFYCHNIQKNNGKEYRVKCINKQDYEAQCIRIQPNKILPLHVSPSWSWSSINPFNLIAYFWQKNREKEFDWDNPYTIKLDEDDLVDFYSGYKNFIDRTQRDGGCRGTLYDVATQKEIFKSLCGTSGNVDNYSCFYTGFKSEKDDYKVAVYDSKQDKTIIVLSANYWDEIASVFEFGRDDLRFLTKLSDSKGEYIAVTPIRGDAKSRELRREGYSIKTFTLFGAGITVHYQKDRKNAFVLYNAKDNYNELVTIETDGVLAIVQGLYYPEDRCLLQIDDKLYVYSTITGELLYSKETKIVKFGDVDWNESDNGSFVLFDRDNSCRACELHDITNNTMTHLLHDEELLYQGDGFVGKNYFASFSGRGELNVIISNTQDGKQIKKLSSSVGHTGGICGKDKNLFFISNVGNFLVYDIANDRECISKKGKLLLSKPNSNRLIGMCIQDKTLYLCNVDTLQEQTKTFESAILATAFGFDDSCIAIGYQKKIDIFDASLQSPSHTLHLNSIPVGMKYSPDGRWLTVCLLDEPTTLYIYDTLQRYKVKKLEFASKLAYPKHGGVLFDKQSCVMYVLTETQAVTFTAK